MARGIDVLRAIDRSESLRTKSSLERWMRENHDAFAARLKQRIADWDVLVKFFADAKLTDRYGNPPKPETARKTWQRVRKKIQDARAKEAARPPVQRRPPDQSAPPIPVRQTVRTKPTDAPTDDILTRMAMANRGRKMPDVIE